MNEKIFQELCTSAKKTDLQIRSRNTYILLEMFKTSQFFEIFQFFINFFSHTNITDSLNIENVKQNAEGCQSSIESCPGSKHTQIFEKKLNSEIFFWSKRWNLFPFQNVILLLEYGGRDYFKTLSIIVNTLHKCFSKCSWIRENMRRKNRSRKITIFLTIKTHFK